MYIIVISLVHIYQAWLLMFYNHAGNATALRAVIEVFDILHYHSLVAVTMLASALLAVAGTLFRLGWARMVVFFIPQNVFAGAMAFGGIVAAFEGAYLDGTRTYLDGTLIGWAHISGDQVAFTALFIIHLFATWRRCNEQW